MAEPQNAIDPASRSSSGAGSPPLRQTRDYLPRRRRPERRHRLDPPFVRHALGADAMPSTTAKRIVLEEPDGGVVRALDGACPGPVSADQLVKAGAGRRITVRGM